MSSSTATTFLFTDLQDSTHLWEQFPRDMKSALARHDLILKSAVEENNGAIIKTTGDGLYAVFPSALEGLQAALAAQLRLEIEPWGKTGALHVRMGLHSGEAQLRDDDYFGPVINRAARIMGAGSGEQVLISETTAVLSQNDLPAGVTLLDLGEHYLRGLSQPVRLFQVQHPELPAEFPALQTLGTVPNNLPAQISSFIGREKEVAEVRALLAPDDQSQRLVTLTGPGGTGKTRLSLQVAGELLQQFLHGVWLVELAPVSDPQGVVQAAAAPMGLREQGERPLEQMLTDYLHAKKALLILDNCEHLIDECARLAETLLLACPQLHILASSREALGIGGERPYRLRSLSMPPASDELTVEDLLQYEAVRLFVDRAAAVKPGFLLDEDNAQNIVQICRRLDGIPLAIELAAARARVLSAAQIAARLDDRFRLLTGGSRTALPRQRTLQALIDWSYDILPAAERVLLCRLSVFSGGWTLETAENTAGFDPLEPYEVLDTLQQLVNKSLVVAEESNLGMRYHLLESIRQYAQAKLTESGEGERMHDRHLSYYLDQSRHAFEELMDLRPPGNWMLLFKPEVDNFRAAWARALDTDSGSALRFAASFSQDWSQIIPLIEIHRFQEKALALVAVNLDLTGPDSSEKNRFLFGRALISTAAVASSARLFTQSIDYASQAAAVAEASGDMETVGWAKTILVVAQAFAEGRDGIRRWLEEEYDLAMRYGRNYRKATLLTSWGSFNFVATGQYHEMAGERWDEGMDMLRSSGNLWIQGQGLQYAADLNGFRGETAEAQRLAEQILAVYSELGDTYAANSARSLLADLAREEGHLERAARLYRETILVWRDTGRAEAGVRTLESLAFVVYEQAQEAADADRPERLRYASTLLGAAAAIRQRMYRPVTSIDKENYERQVMAIREEIGDDHFQTAWDRGQAMDLDQAVLLAEGEETLQEY